MSPRDPDLGARGFSDRLNPILVKEVRAALRGRFFRATFAIALSLATVSSLGFVMLAGGEGDARGSSFFLIVFACMGLAVHGLVPLAAMLSMGAEGDEHTLELLQLSSVPAWRIVTGKLGAALVQAGLVYSAFTPFLMVAFLMRGVDIVDWLVAVVSSLCAASAYSAFGILLGTFGRTRWTRGVLVLFFVIVLLGSSPFGIVLVGRFATVHSVARLSSLSGGVWLVGLGATILFVVLAAARLAHVEENRATPVRVGMSCVLLLAIAGLVAGFDASGVPVATYAALLVALVPMLLAATEAERLPRAVPRRLPRSPFARVLLAPLLPGGARGALFVMLMLVLAVGGFALARSLRPAPVPFQGEVARLGVFAGIVATFVLGPAALLARFTRTSRGRSLVRLAIVLGFAAACVAPVLLSFITRTPQLARLSPASMVFQIEGPTAVLLPVEPGPMLGLLALAALAILANVPRVLASFRELGSFDTRTRIDSPGKGPAHAAS